MKEELTKIDLFKLAEICAKKFYETSGDIKNQYAHIVYELYRDIKKEI